MQDRIIDIAATAARLSVRHSQLVIRSDEGESTLPLEDVAALVVSHPAVMYTQAVLNGLCANGGIFVFCDEKHLPAGMVMSLDGHYTQTERIAAQADAALPVKKQLWKQIVKAKIKAQGVFLEEACGRDHGLLRLARTVRSGDATNIEAQASRRYWQALFGTQFRRLREREDQNRLLNYGYAVLRALVARSICAVGLHPSLGLHHHNRYNPFCLAADLMEPYRPLVDRAVLELVKRRGPQVPIDSECKKQLVGALTLARFSANNEIRGLFDVLSRVSSSLANVFLDKRKKLYLPELTDGPETT